MLNMAFIHWGIDPNIFVLGPLKIRYYGLLFALAFVLGYQIMYWIFVKEKKDLKELESFTIAMILGTVIGARLGHCLFYEPHYYLSNPIEILKVWKGGLASHGAALGLLTALIIFLKYKKRSVTFLWLADRAAISVALGAAFVRIGNFFNSEIIGRPAEVAWSVVFTRVDNIPRHPTQIYEALSYLTIFLILLFRYKKYNVNLPKGQMFGIFLILLFSARFIIEFFKEVQVPFENSLTLDMGQLLSIPLIITGIIILIWSNKNKLNKD